jgi:hypothetical protein
MATNLNSIREFLRIDDKLNSIRTQRRLRDRETQALKIQNEIKHQTSKIDTESSFLGMISLNN